MHKNLSMDTYLCNLKLYVYFIYVILFRSFFPYIYLHVHICTYVYIYTCIYIHVSIYMHINCLHNMFFFHPLCPIDRLERTVIKFRTLHLGERVIHPLSWDLSSLLRMKSSKLIVQLFLTVLFILNCSFSVKDKSLDQI
jgi:hypothetical protein